MFPNRYFLKQVRHFYPRLLQTYLQYSILIKRKKNQDISTSNNDIIDQFV